MMIETVKYGMKNKVPHGYWHFLFCPECGYTEFGGIDHFHNHMRKCNSHLTKRRREFVKLFLEYSRESFANLNIIKERYFKYPEPGRVIDWNWHPTFIDAEKAFIKSELFKCWKIDDLESYLRAHSPWHLLKTPPNWIMNYNVISILREIRQKSIDDLGLNFNEDEVEVCGGCRKWRPLEEFCVRKKQPREINCVPPDRDATVRWRHECKKRGFQFSVAHQTCFSCQQDQHDETYYASLNYLNVDGTDFRLKDAKKMLKEQNFICAISGCNKSLSSIRKDGVEVRLAVDHEHNSDIVRGFLCSNHNRAIGLLNDDISQILGLAEYLKNFKKVRKICN